MYAVAFDFNISELKKYYGNPYNNAYNDIRIIMLKYGFRWIQGSTYITDNEDLANLSFLMTELSEKEWVARSVKDIRAFEIKKWSNYTDFVKRKYSRVVQLNKIVNKRQV